MFHLAIFNTVPRHAAFCERLFSLKYLDSTMSLSSHPGYYDINPYSAGIDSSRQNLTSTDKVYPPPPPL